MLKREYHRDEKLRNLARGAPCMVDGLIPFALVTRHDHETTVWAHSNLSWHGKGAHIKAHDCFGFFACATCHAEIDQGKHLDREQRRSVQAKAMRVTRTYLVGTGAILGAGVAEIESDALWLDGWLAGKIRVAP